MFEWHILLKNVYCIMKISHNLFMELLIHIFNVHVYNKHKNHTGGSFDFMTRKLNKRYLKRRDVYQHVIMSIKFEV